jgi:hypothetical protein
MNWDKKIEPGFKTPDNFFENFEKNILEKITDEKPVIQLSFWKKNKKLIISTAAILVVSVGITFLYNNNETIITSETIAYEDILQLNDWENELTDREIAQISNELLIDESSLEEEIMLLDYSEIN